MKFIDKLERKFGRFGVPNLTVYIIGCYVLGYFLAMFAPGVLNMLSLDMSMVMKGQIWRLVTWVIYPPSSVGGTGNLVMFLLAIFFFLLSDRYFTGTYLGNFPVHIVYFFRCFVYCDRSSTFTCIYRWLCGYERDRLFSWRKYFYHILYQSFYFPCLCSHISGSSAASYVCDPDQDEMDGLCIRTVHCVGYRILSSSRALGRCSTDRSITFKLCDLLFQYP